MERLAKTWSATPVALPAAAPAAASAWASWPPARGSRESIGALGWNNIRQRTKPCAPGLLIAGRQRYAISPASKCSCPLHLDCAHGVSRLHALHRRNARGSAIWPPQNRARRYDACDAHEGDSRASDSPPSPAMERAAWRFRGVPRCVPRNPPLRQAALGLRAGAGFLAVDHRVLRSRLLAHGPRHRFGPAGPHIPICTLGGACPVARPCTLESHL